MDECVVDAAAVVDALAGKGASAIVLRGLLKESISNAPHLLDAEVGHALRRAVLSDEISEEQARAALDALPYLIDNRYPHSPRLIEYTWQLRHNVTFYDALYVALATALDVPLLTGDSRLAAARAFRAKSNSFGDIPLRDANGAVVAGPARRQPWTASSAALNVLLGRITAVVMSLSGA